MKPLFKVGRNVIAGAYQYKQLRLVPFVCIGNERYVLLPEGARNVLATREYPYYRYPLRRKLTEYENGLLALLDRARDAPCLHALMSSRYLSASPEQFAYRSSQTRIDDVVFDDEMKLDLLTRFIPLARPALWQTLHLIKADYASTVFVLSSYLEPVKDFYSTQKLTEPNRLPPTLLIELSKSLRSILECRSLDRVPSWPDETQVLIRAVIRECELDSSVYSSDILSTTIPDKLTKISLSGSEPS